MFYVSKKTFFFPDWFSKNETLQKLDDVSFSNDDIDFGDKVLI